MRSRMAKAVTSRTAELARERALAAELAEIAPREPQAALVGALHDEVGNRLVQAALSGETFGMAGLVHDALALGAAGVPVADSVAGVTASPLGVAVARRAAGEREVFADDADQALGTALSRGGRPLPEGLRAALERAFGGVDFSGVRLHADGAAARAAEAINARAFTVGQDVYFGAGELDVASGEGRHLLAHELTHVVQHQEGRLGGGGGAGEAGGMAVSSPTDTTEREAEAVAAEVSAVPWADVAGTPEAALGAEGALESAEAVTGPQGGVASRQEAAPAPAGDPQQPFTDGRAVGQFGIAYQRDGVNLYEQPAGKRLARLPFNTRLYVDREENGWYQVTTDQGQAGWVATTHVKVNLPEPNAKIHWVAPGETALDISRLHYGGTAQWGSDHRFFVNGLVFVNQGPGARGIYKPDASAGWETTQVREGYMLWIPSVDFMRSLRGRVSSGSITHEAWQGARQAAEAAADLVVGAAAFVGGALHGAVESLWDVLVGLKDLAGMIWEVLESLFTGDLLADAQGLWNDLSALDWGALVQGWLSDFDARWNAEGVATRWHFRGWVVGYAVMEALMLFFSGGVIQGIKWAGKASRVSRVLASMPRLVRLAETVKRSRAYERIAEALGKGAALADDAGGAVKWIEQTLADPVRIWGKSPEQIAEVFTQAGAKVTIEQSTKGSRLSRQIRVQGHKVVNNVQVHPGGGRHGGSYYKISTTDRGILKVVDRTTYVPLAGERATIVFADAPSGWLLQALAANGALQAGAGAVEDEE